MVAIAQSSRALQRGLRSAADEDRQRRALRRQGIEYEVLERMEATGERFGRAGPEVPPELDCLVQIRPTLMESVGRAEVAELLLVPADADAGEDPAVGQRVERRELLGEDDRIPLGDDDHAGPEPQPRVARADPGERLDRVVVDPIVGRTCAVVDEHVVRRPDGFPAQPVGDIRGGLDRLAAGKVGEVRQADPVSHPRIVAGHGHLATRGLLGQVGD